MTLDQIAGLIKDFALASIMFFLYWNERIDRRSAVDGHLADARQTVTIMTDALRATTEALKAVAFSRDAAGLEDR